MGKLYILQVLVLSILVVSCGEEKKEEDPKPTPTKVQEDTSTIKVTAMDFNNTMVNYQKMAMEQVNIVFDSKVEDLPSVLDDVVFELRIYGEDLKSLSKTTFDYGQPFVVAIKNLNDYYVLQFDQKLDSILNLKGDKRKESLDHYHEQFSEGEEVLFDSIRVAQDQFADYHKIDLID